MSTVTNYAESYMKHVNEEPTVLEYITIAWASTTPSGKTQKYVVTNNKSEDVLGFIKWHGPWRQYVFSPVPRTLFSSGCLADIEAFLDEANELHKQR